MGEELTGTELGELMVSVGTHRHERPLSPIEVGRRIKTLIDSGKDRSFLQTILGLKGDTMINKFLQLLTLPDEFQDIIIWGKTQKNNVCFDTAYQISRLDSFDAKRTLLKEILEYSMTREEAADVIRLYKGDNFDIRSAVQTVLSRRKIIIKRELLICRLDVSLIGLINVKGSSKLLDIVSGLIPTEMIVSLNLKGNYLYIITDKAGKDELERKASAADTSTADLLIESLQKGFSD